MKEQLVWQERFSMGVDILDREHRRLFSIINRIFASVQQDSNIAWACQEGIKYFKNHALKHFKEEEEYMRSINYKEMKMHKRIHDNFRKNTLPSLEMELEQSNFSKESVMHFLGVCAGWLLGHTLTDDMAIVGKGNSSHKWKNLMPEEEVSAIGQEMINILYSVFRLRANVISDHYCGEKFGHGIYYRLSYVTEHGEHWDILLAFEERMLLNTLSVVMGFQYDEINPTVVNTARYMSQQFLESLRSCFPSVDVCELKEENLLEYPQFKNIFDRQHPRFSLLFDTGVGYFAFCVITKKAAKVEHAINAKNAMHEIEHYLESRPVVKKNKILVVDDSSTMRMFLEKLLSENYDIQLAESGLSAFRSIILNKPDLVLLDYEMPICDGRQVLEMIRAEESFADTPVIFLTGREDPESVSKVMSLNPEGYMLKTSRPTEIKKNIELFFKNKNNQTVSTTP